MDIFEAIQEESRKLEKETAVLVEASSSEPQIRQEQATRIKDRFEAIESTRVKYVYPAIRDSAEGKLIADEYQKRVDEIRAKIEQLQSTPADSPQIYQRNAEQVREEVADLLQWEYHIAHPASAKIMGPDAFAEKGEQIQSEEEELFTRLLTQS